MTPLRAAIIGTGSFSHTHAQALQASKPITLAGACDTDAARLREFTGRWRCPGYPEWNTMLTACTPDIVIIATPDETHARMIRDVAAHAQAPRLIIAEKPVCVTEEELTDLSKLSEPPAVVIDHSRRFNEGFRQLAALITDGKLGACTGGTWRYYAGWFHVGVHAVDTLRMLLGDLSCVSAEKQAIDRYPEDPLLRVRLRMQETPHAEILLEGIPEHPYKIFEAELRFARGRIRIHWNDITVDRATEDSYAPALFPGETIRAQSIDDALRTLYTMSADFLGGGDRKLLEIAGMEAARGTMQVLFDAQRLAAA